MGKKTDRVYQPRKRFKSKSSGGIPVPTSGEKIVLTGLVHMEDGESLERQLAFAPLTRTVARSFSAPRT